MELNLSAHQNYKEETKEKEGFLNFLYADLKRSLIIGATMALIALFATLVSSLLGSLVYDLFGFYEVFVIRNIVNIFLYVVVGVYVFGFGIYHFVKLINLENKGFIPIADHIIASIFTGGIWAIIWYYRTTKYFDETLEDEHRNPTTEMLLSGFVPYYHLYWTYVSAKRIEDIYRSKGTQEDIKIPALIVAFFFYWFGGAIYLQVKLNQAISMDVVGAPIVNKQQNQPTANFAYREQEISNVLKQYKDLLDQGILTEEEFELKKKEVLNIK